MVLEMVYYIVLKSLLYFELHRSIQRNSSTFWPGSLGSRPSEVWDSWLYFYCAWFQIVVDWFYSEDGEASHWLLNDGLPLLILGKLQHLMVLTLICHLSLNQLNKNSHSINGVVELGDSVVIFQLSLSIYLPLPLCWCQNVQVCKCTLISEFDVYRFRADCAENRLV